MPLSPYRTIYPKRNARIGADDRLQYCGVREIVGYAELMFVTKRINVIRWRRGKNHHVDPPFESRHERPDSLNIPGGCFRNVLDDKEQFCSLESVRCIVIAVLIGHGVICNIRDDLVLVQDAGSLVLVSVGFGEKGFRSNLFSV